MLARQVEVPSYLQGEASLDWGRLESLEPYAPNTVAPTVEHGEQRMWGWVQQGEIGDPPPGIASPLR